MKICFYLYTCYVPDICKAIYLHYLFESLQQHWEADAIIIQLLQMGRLWLRKEKELVPNHALLIHGTGKTQREGTPRLTALQYCPWVIKHQG